MSTRATPSRKLPRPKSPACEISTAACTRAMQTADFWHTGAAGYASPARLFAPRCIGAAADRHDADRYGRGSAPVRPGPSADIARAHRERARTDPRPGPSRGNDDHELAWPSVRRGLGCESELDRSGRQSSLAGAVCGSCVGSAFAASGNDVAAASWSHAGDAAGSSAHVSGVIAWRLRPPHGAANSTVDV